MKCSRTGLGALESTFTGASLTIQCYYQLCTIHMANYLLNASDAALRTLIGHLDDIQMKDFSGSKIIVGLDVFCAFFKPLPIPSRSCSLISRTCPN